MNSKITDDQLRAALKRRTERMAPAKGWEERILAKTATPRRRFKLKWLMIPGVAAAVAAVLVALFIPSAPSAPESERPRKQPLAATPHQPAPEKKIAVVTVEKSTPPPAPEVQRHVKVEKETPTSPDIYAFEPESIEIDEEMSILQEIDALLYAYNY